MQKRHLKQSTHHSKKSKTPLILLLLIFLLVGVIIRYFMPRSQQNNKATASSTTTVTKTKVTSKPVVPNNIQTTQAPMTAVKKLIFDKISPYIGSHVGTILIVLDGKIYFERGYGYAQSKWD